ncbi:MAG: M20/M25/M40 family metallo-hydrolase [Streptococcaceae bacterium]|jgi:acetylornithine deacetylase|nr:M20/M25/M40 family metallo-hydrolase [Streptococcaceae bacterium]
MDAVELLKALIARPSVSGNEVEILGFVEKLLRDAAFDFVLAQKTFVAGRLDAAQGKGEKAIILTGHVDTVPAGDLTTWEASPWEAQETTDRVIGLGASDMKAGVAGHLEVALGVPRETLTRDLWVVVTANEELDGQGSADFADWYQAHTNYSEACAIISEPTDLETVRIGHRGNRFVRLTFRGGTGHASEQKHYASSALYQAVYFLSTIDDIYDRLQVYTDKILGRPTFVPSSIVAGDPKAPNKAAGQAEVIVDFRTVPKLEHVFDRVMSEIAEKYGFSWEYAVPYVDATLTDEKADFIQELLTLSGAVIGVSRGSTDQGFYERVGIRTVVYGPGPSREAHQPNESVEKAALWRFVQVERDWLKAMNVKAQ